MEKKCSDDDVNAKTEYKEVNAFIHLSLKCPLVLPSPFLVLHMVRFLCEL